MHDLTRRDFTGLLIASAVLPFAAKDSTTSVLNEAATPNRSLPDSIAGHPLTPEEQELTSKFLARHEEGLTNLRHTDLPNGLCPAFDYTSELSSRR